MNKIYLTVVFFLMCSMVFGQSPDSVKQQKQVRYYKSKLGLDEDKAKQVNAIHDQYKSSLKAVTDNTGLTEAEKRKAAERIMAEKNKKLSGLLTVDQLYAVVPTTERKRSKQERKN